MLYLIIDENGDPKHKWSIDPENDFKDVQILGPAIVDENGFPEDSANLAIVNGEVVINQSKKDSSKTKIEEEKLNVEKAKKAKHDFLNTDISSFKTIADLKGYLGLLQEFLKHGI